MSRRRRPAPSIRHPGADAVSTSGPPVWLSRHGAFEATQEPGGDGGGAIHVAVWMPHEQADARVATALAVSGRMVRDEFAPAWWTLADAAGNEADTATTQRPG